VRFDRPVQRTRETIEIIRQVSGGDRLDHHGPVYEFPLPDGEGRSFRSALPPTPIPVYVAALGPANLRLTGALADGWIGNSFFPETADVFTGPISEGARQAGRKLSDVELTVAVGLEFTDDVEAAGRRHADGYAFTFGAMGSARTNFYNAAFGRQGFAADVAEVQRLWQAGDREAARRRVPIEIGLGTNLIGPEDRIKARLRLYREAGVSTLRVGLDQSPGRTLDHHLADLGRLVDLVAAVDGEAQTSMAP
jgi:alkanesulfonate monooxygenase SsuD/methylene tetrahydromethanopterin reductase-like flavin-dependent oxidoreductase (luciferase family)